MCLGGGVSAELLGCGLKDDPEPEGRAVSPKPGRMSLRPREILRRPVLGPGAGAGVPPGLTPAGMLTPGRAGEVNTLGRV